MWIMGEPPCEPEDGRRSDCRLDGLAHVRFGHPCRAVVCHVEGAALALAREHDTRVGWGGAVPVQRHIMNVKEQEAVWKEQRAKPFEPAGKGRGRKVSEERRYRDAVESLGSREVARALGRREPSDAELYPLK